MALSEAATVSAAYQAAMVRLGLLVASRVRDLFSRSKTPDDRTVREALRVVGGARAELRTLTVAYYRLHRALHTGFTVAKPGAPASPGDSVPLDVLRRDFASMLPPPREGFAQYVVPAGGGQSVILDSDVEAFTEQDFRDAEEVAFADALQNLTGKGVTARERKVAELRRRFAARVGGASLDSLIAEIEEKSDRKAGAVAGRVAANAGRQSIDSAVRRDRRALGYVRLSRTGTPCGFCAMLISRGAVYSSASSASVASGNGRREKGEDYHDDCQCYSEPVYSRSQYDSSDLYSLNRKYAREWPGVTNGLSGKAALSAWRKHVRKNNPELF